MAESDLLWEEPKAIAAEARLAELEARLRSLTQQPSPEPSGSA